MSDKDWLVNQTSQAITSKRYTASKSVVRKRKVCSGWILSTNKIVVRSSDTGNNFEVNRLKFSWSSHALRSHLTRSCSHHVLQSNVYWYCNFARDKFAVRVVSCTKTAIISLAISDYIVSAHMPSGPSLSLEVHGIHFVDELLVKRDMAKVEKSKICRVCVNFWLRTIEFRWSASWK